MQYLLNIFYYRFDLAPPILLIIMLRFWGYVYLSAALLFLTLIAPSSQVPYKECNIYSPDKEICSSIISTVDFKTSSTSSPLIINSIALSISQTADISGMLGIAIPYGTCSV